jgi:ubiquitin-like modifier-activating enzyme ATG7
MKWRMAPDLNVEIIRTTKFLLIGAGTLGCHVARNLLGWGARNINFIDCGYISYSNPVRQSLYNFADAEKGQNPKAETAAKKLKEIFPSVNSEGFSFQIPLPGRTLIDEKAEESYLGKVEKLEKLITENDVIFLLTDSRESRWLPTLLAKKHGKICITAAIGFDTFVVMRHGSIIENYNEKIGCYFCNDIVSPVDTTFNRTLDQQCTISRPGVSAICSGYASEIGISMIQKDNSLGLDVPEVLRGNIKESTILKMKQEKSRK